MNNYSLVYSIDCDLMSFSQIMNDDKRAEFRKDTCCFKCDDLIILREYDGHNDKYTGDKAILLITCVTKGGDIPMGYVMFSFRRLI